MKMKFCSKRRIYERVSMNLIVESIKWDGDCSKSGTIWNKWEAFRRKRNACFMKRDASFIKWNGVGRKWDSLSNKWGACGKKPDA